MVVNPYSLSQPIATTDTFKILEEFVHPLFGDIDSATHDFMLSKLSGKSTMKPIRLNRYGLVPMSEERLVAMGWGVTAENDFSSGSDILAHVNLTYITNSQCINVTLPGADDLGTFEGEIFDEYVCIDFSWIQTGNHDTHLISL